MKVYILLRSIFKLPFKISATKISRDWKQEDSGENWIASARHIWWNYNILKQAMNIQLIWCQSSFIKNHKKRIRNTTF